MKSGEVKTKKQNYLVFLRNCLSAVFLAASCQAPPALFAFLHTHHPSWTQVIPLNPWQTYHELKEAAFPIRTPHIAQSPDLHQRMPLSHAEEG